MAANSRQYRERLLPPLGAWLVSAALVTMLAVAYGAALGPVVGWVLGLGLGLAVAGALVVTAPLLCVDPTGIRAGQAFLPGAAMGELRLLTPDEAQLARGAQADHRVFTALRAGTRRGAVWVEVADGDDPHSAWLIGSRHPEELARAVTDTIGGSSTAGRAHE